MLELFLFFRFKVFKNGEIVYTDRVGSLDTVVSVMRPFLDGVGGGSSGVLDRLAAMICSALTATFDGKQVTNLDFNFGVVSVTRKTQVKLGAFQSRSRQSPPPLTTMSMW